MKRLRNSFALAAVLATPACGATPGTGSPNDPGSPLLAERMIELPNVAGRIDHLAADVRHHRIFVAELGNGSADAVDVDSGASRRIGGLSEPQGLAYLPYRDE